MLAGLRYLPGCSADFLSFVSSDLHRLSFEETREFYADVEAEAVPLNKREIALLGCNDRFFLLTALLNRPDAIHPWLFDRCREVEAAPDDHLDLWGREHYKSTIITFAGCIQEIIRDPEITIGLFSVSKDIATKFVAQIKEEIDANDDLRIIYDDVFWLDRRDAEKNAREWRSNSFVVRRKTNPKEATIEAHGLIDAMPTGRHFRLRIYDDLVTERHLSPDMVKKVTERWELSDNLGGGENRRQHAGTRYCTVGDTLITMGDWSQKPIRDVHVGDVVVGWELRGGKRWLRRSTVKAIGSHLTQPVNLYAFDTGRTVTATADHRWFRGPHGGGPEYNVLALPGSKRRAKGIRAARGQTHVCELLEPLSASCDRDAAWLAGFFDGEGTIKKNKNHPSGVVCITQTMSNPDLIEECRRVLTTLGFSFSEAWHSPSALPGQEGWSDRCVFLINGGWRERYRFLASISPVRRAALIDTLFGQLFTQRRMLCSVEDAGHQDVFWLETETGNYVANGFCSKNSFADTYGQILERGILKPRLFPATDDGTINGNPVFFSQAKWEAKKKTQRSTISAQLLQNPLGGMEATFEAAWLRPTPLRPRTLNVYIMADPSRGRSATSDRTAIAVIGIDPQGNKFLLDGYRHRMKLSERWDALSGLYKKWSQMHGVILCQVGYERFGAQSDDEYFQEKMAAGKEADAFAIQELNWTRDGTTSKKERVERLEPNFRNSQFFLPPRVWHAGLGECFWSFDAEQGKVVYRPAKGPTRLEAEAIRAGEPYRVMAPIKRKDEDGNLYDLTEAFAQEFTFFPFSPKDDLIDAVSRIYDMSPEPPVSGELEEAMRLPVW